LFEEIKAMNGKELGYFVIILDSVLLSNRMQAFSGPEALNLNNISHKAAKDLIRMTMEAGVNLKKAILDTVGDPNRYKDIMKREFKGTGIDFTIESKADFNYPVVSAASICAKVTRDKDLREWKFPEMKEFERNYGCGYPSDPLARKWLQANFDPVFGFPTLVRFSWKTCENILKDNHTLCNWFDPVKPEKEQYQKGKPAQKPAAPQKTQ